MKTSDFVTYNPIVVALPKQMLPPNHVVSVPTQLVCCRFPAFERAREWVREWGVTTKSQWKAHVNARSLPHYVLVKPDFEPPYGYLHEGWVSWDDWLGRENPKNHLVDLADVVTTAASKTERERIRKQNYRKQQAKREKQEELETRETASVGVASGNSTASTGPCSPPIAPPIENPSIENPPIENPSTSAETCRTASDNAPSKRSRRSSATYESAPIEMGGASRERRMRKAALGVCMRVLHD